MCHLSIQNYLCLTKRKRKEGHRERDSNKQINSSRYIHIISPNTAIADSGNEANKKSSIVLFSDIYDFCANDYH